MRNAVVPSSSSSSSTIFSSCLRQPKTHQARVFVGRMSSTIDNPRTRFCSSNANLKVRGLRLACEAQRSSFRCNCSSSRPGAPGSGENESRGVLDAFFLGKALAEVLNERIESTVGEVLGAIGRLQSEQQKQVQEIQDEVFERAKRAKEKAAREAMEAQGLAIPKPTTLNRTTSAAASTSNNGITSVAPSSTNENGAINNRNSTSFSSSSSNGNERIVGSGDEDSL